MANIIAINIASQFIIFSLFFQHGIFYIDSVESDKKKALPDLASKTLD